MACQHESMVDCPLYHASHTPGSGGCVAADWQRGCAVARGAIGYETCMERVRNFAAAQVRAACERTIQATQIGATHGEPEPR